MIRIVFLLLVFSTSAVAQTSAIDRYIGNVLDIENLTEDELAELLPLDRPEPFATYVASTMDWPDTVLDWRNFMRDVESLRLNKLIGASTGGAGTTALVAPVSVPALVGLGIERGSVLQQNNGTVTTLRGNALGLAKLAVGAEQFPYCAQIDMDNCRTLYRRLRQLSGSVSFEHLTSPGQTPLDSEDLFGDEFRMASWGVHLDLTPSNNLDDPKYIENWHTEIARLRGSEIVGNLSLAVFMLAETDGFQEGNKAILNALKAADPQNRKAVLEAKLNAFITQLDQTNPLLREEIQALQRASEAYFTLRDAAVRAAHIHKLSLKYTNSRAQNEPSRSTLRLVYSHQPTDAPVLVTLNFGASFYNRSNDDARLRDLQFGAQIDRPLPSIGRFERPVLSLAGYYQWMKHDALLTIPAGDFAPGTAIALAGEASKLLGTKGHIGIVQLKVSVPISDTVVIPLSTTWSNRTELIKENDVRVQVGFTLDLDSLFLSDD